MSQPKAQRRKPKLEFNVLVTSYEIVVKDVAFLKKFSWELCTIDEAHRLKNPQSKLYKVLNKEYTLPCRLLLSGTPVQNRLPELYSLLSFIAPKLFPLRKLPSFLMYFQVCTNKTASSSLGGEGQGSSGVVAHASDLHTVLRPFLLRRSMADVNLDKKLPPLSQIVVYTGMSAMQKVYYKLVLTKNAAALGAANARSLTNVIQQLRKACNHPYLFQGTTLSDDTLYHSSCLIIHELFSPFPLLLAFFNRIRG